jgi:hypothetical protein
VEVARVAMGTSMSLRLVVRNDSATTQKTDPQVDLDPATEFA